MANAISRKNSRQLCEEIGMGRDPVKSPVGQKPHGQKPYGQKPGWSKAPNKQTSKFQNKFIGYLHM